jgi:hypothetical protein
MVNIRQSTDWLGVQAVKKLRSAHTFAGVIGLPLNAFVTVAPFRGGEWDGAPTPADEFAAFRNWVGVWVRRHAEISFTSVGVVHAKPDGTDAHLHALLHLPKRALITDLRAALAARYREEDATHIRADDGRCYRHDSGYYGSTLNCMISHMSPQAAWALKMLGQRTRRRRERAPFVGKRYFVTANISERAQFARRNEANIVRMALSGVRRRSSISGSSTHRPGWRSDTVTKVAGFSQ